MVVVGSGLNLRSQCVGGVSSSIAGKQMPDRVLPAIGKGHRGFVSMTATLSPK